MSQTAAIATDVGALSRGARRKRATRNRLVRAALDVFLERGFDAATTGEIAARADLGAGTFYLHFRDKRDIFETIARNAARDMIEQWRTTIPGATNLADLVGAGIETAAAYWSESPARTRLLLDGGPSFSSEAHVQLVRYLADVLHGEVDHGRERDPSLPSPEVIATFSLALAIEIGRIVAGSPSPGEATTAIQGTIRFVRDVLSKSGLPLS